MRHCFSSKRVWFELREDPRQLICDLQSAGFSASYFNAEFAYMVKGMIEEAPLAEVWEQIDSVA